MEFLKELFDGKALTYDELSAKVTEKKFKVVDVAAGQYVDKSKYDRLSGEHETAKTSAADFKKKYEEQVKALDGDDGLKKQIETLKGDLEKAQTGEKAASEKLTARERLDVAMGKVGGDKKLARLLVLDASEKLSDKVDFDAAIDAVIKADPETYKIDDAGAGGAGSGSGAGGAKIKTPGNNGNKTPPAGKDDDATLRESMGLPPLA